MQSAPQRGVDTEGSWVKKQDKLQYGYKRHYACDQKAGLVLSVSTTGASAHESKHMKKVVTQSQLPLVVLYSLTKASDSNEALLKRIVVSNGKPIVVLR